MNNFLITFFFDFFVYIESLYNNDDWIIFFLSLLKNKNSDLISIFLIWQYQNDNLDLNFKITLYLFFLNAIFINFFFLKVTPLTFWIGPGVILLLIGIFTFLIFDISLPSNKIYKFINFFFKIVFIYQLLLLYIYLSFKKNGLFLQVGLNAFYQSPINFDLMKLLCIIFSFFLLIITIWLCDYYFWLTKNVFKPEIFSIICFLGFSLTTVFLQSDLFVIFFYMEMISFCLYAFLFAIKRTLGQLQILIRYVLLSMWSTTFYVIGLVIFLAHKQNFLESSNFLDIYFLNETSNSMSFLTILFFIFYFLFKLGAGPFYIWVVDVYSASSIIFLPIISILPKIIFLPLAYFIFISFFVNFLIQISTILLIFGILTIFIGVFGIIGTTKLKEIYSWSSIIHTGNLLCILSCCCVQWSISAFFIFYLLSYFVTSLSFLLIIISFWNKKTGFFISTILEFNNLNLIKIAITMPLIIFFAILTGFTPFVIFFMKFVLLIAISQIFGIIPTLILGLLNILGAFAYLRIVRLIISKNLLFFNSWKEFNNNKMIVLNMAYPIAVFLNCCLIYMIFGIFVLFELIDLFSLDFTNTKVIYYFYSLSLKFSKKKKK